MILIVTSLSFAQTIKSDKELYKNSSDAILQSFSSLFDSRNDTPENITTYGKGYRFEQNGWIYIHIEGDPYQLGFQNGYLAAPEIKEITKSLYDRVYLNTGKDWSFFVDAGERVLAPNLPPEHLEEIKGIADGARAAGVNVTWQEILAWNAFHELLCSWWSIEQEKLDVTLNAQQMEHCSAFIATGNATEGSRIVIAHNTWISYYLGQFCNVILDIVPLKGHRMFMQSFAGMITSGTDFAINDGGIVGTETSIIGLDQYDPKGIPDFSRVRKALQYANSLDEFAKTMIEGNNGGSDTSWLVGDIKTGEIMRLELGLKYYNITKSKDGYFIGFNAPTDPRIRNLECSDTGYGDIRRSSGARQVRLTQLMEQYYGKINRTNAKTILADHYDVYLKKINPCSRTVEGHCELDPMDYVSDPKWGLPFTPGGTLDGLVTDSAMAKNLSLWARWGNSAGMPFNASQFLKENIQWSDLEGYLKDRPSQPWTQFYAGEIKPV
jgi:hypothetical protein